jgi:flagellar motor switch protein FliN
MADNDDVELLRFLGIPLAVNVELDRRTLTIRGILDLKTGSVLILRRPAGENLDVRVGGIRIGSGEAVIVDNTLAIRLTGLDSKP